jgi:hypothetical protein
MGFVRAIRTPYGVPLLLRRAAEFGFAEGKIFNLTLGDFLEIQISAGAVL